MYYWNKNNFKGLKAIGAKYRLKHEYVEFANYCLFKEQGLKKNALKAIDKFVLSTSKKDIQKQKQIAEELVSLSFYNPEIHGLMSHPLRQYLLSVFKNWSDEDSSSASPYRWIGYLNQDLSSFEKALTINPNDEISITILTQAHLNHVDYQTHHLSESRFIGKRSDAKSSLKMALQLITRLKSQEIKDKLLEEIRYYQQLLIAWEEYTSLEQEISFPEWCNKKGKNFEFWSIVYYEK